MFKLSYSANGLTNLDFFSAIDEVEKAGFDGIELFFEPKEFNPFTITDGDIIKIKNYFSKKNITPVAISTATICFLSDIPHEPSLISLNVGERQRRIDLIKKGIDLAKKLGIPIVSFQSGYLREEHTNNPSVDPQKLLIDGIRECLKDIGNITLVIEPEPGMYIETLSEAKTLIKKVNSENFKLHLDICHAYCSEDNYVQAIGQAIPDIAYMHLADIKEGYSLKLIVVDEFSDNLSLDLDSTGYLVYSKQDNFFAFLDKNNCICFYFDPSGSAKTKEVKKIIHCYISNVQVSGVYLSDSELIQCPNNVELENKAFLDSIGGVSFDVLKKAKLVLRYLRNKRDDGGKLFINKPVCNTIKGKVHYHEIPGSGEIDFKGVLREIIEKKYSGYITVELYNHSDIWKEVLPGSRKYLLDCIK